MIAHAQISNRVELETLPIKNNIRNVEVRLARLDLLHPNYGGNKWFKLKYNLQQAKQEGYKTIITFGGAYSNHLRATAFAAKEFGFKLICLVRGEQTEPLNEALQSIKRLGGTLHFISRDEYKLKTDLVYQQNLQKLYGAAYIIPEGGANVYGILGCSEIPNLIDEDFDYIACACGTFTTLAGLSLGINENQTAIGINILNAKGYGVTQTNDLVEQTLKQFSNLKPSTSNTTVVDDYHFGGYAKKTKVLENFMTRLKKDFGIQTEFVYTAKLLYGIINMIERGKFKPNSRIVVLMSNPANTQA